MGLYAGAPVEDLTVTHLPTRWPEPSRLRSCAVGVLRGRHGASAESFWSVRRLVAGRLHRVDHEDLARCPVEVPAAGLGRRRGAGQPQNGRGGERSRLQTKHDARLAHRVPPRGCSRSTRRSAILHPHPRRPCPPVPVARSATMVRRDSSDVDARRRDRPRSGPAATSPWARPGREESTNFAVYAPEATRPGCASSTTDGTRPGTLTEQTLGIWHGALPGVAPGQRYGFRADGPVGPERGPAVQPRQAAARPLRPRGQRAGRADGPIYGLRPPPRRRRRRTQRAATTRLRAVRPRSVVVRDDFDWGDDEQVRPRTRGRDTVVYELHVKGFTAAARPRCPRSCAGRTPASPPRRGTTTSRTSASRGRAAAGAPVRLRAGPGRARADELLGLQLDRLLRPAQRLLLVRRPRRAGRRVQGDGQGAARGRARGDPRRGLQPHRRGRPARADAELPRPRRRRLLQARRLGERRRDVLRRHRLRQHRRRGLPAGAAADPRLAALLGHRDARRRLPLRPDAGADPHRPPRRPEPGTSSPRSARTRCCGT